MPLVMRTNLALLGGDHVPQAAEGPGRLELQLQAARDIRQHLHPAPLMSAAVHFGHMGAGLNTCWDSASLQLQH